MCRLVRAGSSLRSRLLWVLILSSWGVPVSRGQVLPFVHYSTESELHPLPSAEVHTVFQDDHGFVWVGIFSSGILRYDGSQLVHFGTDDGLRDLSVWEIGQDALGRLWVGSNGGLSVSERPVASYTAGGRMRFTASPGGTPLVDVAVGRNRMAFGEEGSLWVGTEDRGLIRYRTDSEVIGPADTIRTNLRADGENLPVRSVVVRRDGTAWAALHGGGVLVVSPEGKRLRVLSERGGARDQSINALHETASGELWGGRQNGEVVRLLAERDTFTAVPSGEKLGANVSDIRSLSDGSVWVASEGAGILVLDRDGALIGRITRRTGLLGDVVHGTSVDSEGNIWISQSGGISKLRFNFRAFESLTAKSLAGETPVLPSASVNAVLPAPRPQYPCRVWAGTTEGGLVCVHDDGTSTTLNHESGLPSDWVNAVVEDSRGRLWVGTLRGLSGLAIGEGARLPTAPRLATAPFLGGSLPIGTYYRNSVLAAAVLQMPTGADGGSVESVWFPSYHLLACLLGDDWFAFGPSSGLPAAIIQAVAYDDGGLLWVGTRDRGLFRSNVPITSDFLGTLASEGRGSSSALDPDEVYALDVARPVMERVWLPEDGALSDQIENLLWADGAMWVGTPEGLAVIDADQVRTVARFTTKEGLPANNATSLSLSSDRKAIWIGTNQGLAAIDLATRQVVSTVSKHEGLLDNEVWFFGSVRSGRDGSVYFGTAKGVAIYRPSLDVPNVTPPRVELTGADYSEDGWGNNAVVLSYAGLSFANERAVLFRTRLLGHDQDWSAPTSETKIRYTNLSAFLFSRAYTFEVLAANGDGVWAREPLRYSFDVRPAWWLRWWAVLSYASLLATSLYALAQLQRRRLTKAERQRARDREQRLRIEAAEGLAAFLSRDNERKTQELEGARELQLSMLPKVLPQLEGFDVAAFMRTATEVGGDYYDFHLSDEGVLTVAIGDATGHGARAGTMVTATKVLFSFLAGEHDLAAILRRSTEALRHVGIRRMFMALALVRVRGYSLELLGAGMPPALIYRAYNGDVEVIPLKGMPLGTGLRFPYRTTRVELQPGDKVILMSDGSPELASPSGEMYGYDKAIGAVTEVGHLPARSMIERLSSIASSWASTGRQVRESGANVEAVFRDDVTFVVLEAKESASPGAIRTGTITGVFDSADTVMR